MLNETGYPAGYGIPKKTEYKVQLSTPSRRLKALFLKIMFLKDWMGTGKDRLGVAGRCVRTYPRAGG